MLNSVLALLAKNSSGHTAAALLDQWRAITLGGVWASGDAIDLGTETEALGESSAEDVPSVARCCIPTEVSEGCSRACCGGVERGVTERSTQPRVKDLIEGIALDVWWSVDTVIQRGSA